LWDPRVISTFNRNQGDRDFELRWEEFERRPCDRYEEGEFVKRDRSPLHSCRCSIKHVARVSSSTATGDAVKDVKGSNTTKGIMRYDDRADHIITLESIEKGRLGQATLMLREEVAYERVHGLRKPVNSKQKKRASKEEKEVEGKEEEEVENEGQTEQGEAASPERRPTRGMPGLLLLLKGRGNQIRFLRPLPLIFQCIFYDQ
jgi:hypothetical protein